MLGFALPDPALGRYAIRGQTETGLPLLGAFLLANPILGFTVAANGVDVTFPDWGGRYFGATGGRGIGSTAGQLLASENKAHSHPIPTQNERLIWFTTGGYGIYTTYDPGGENTGSSGGTYARPETVAMPMVIIGDRP